MCNKYNLYISGKVDMMINYMYIFNNDNYVKLLLFYKINYPSLSHRKWNSAPL